ncbi:response regulator/sensor histidine kinase [Pseudomonas syringae pv. actinidiae ICMP 18804]|uniref:histidine kinase n=1 Tax=Pseudomonas syringae pv. actinidiae TaxID=103796 RepID=A0A3M4KEB0_PSESF|nr:transporter substrate-binding domain-containing protein [Pseudomonas syringae]EPM92133.1 response regulator/sensor histidine kinase [Pseudomonas syringae pv. actinidiae ICMP 18804]RMQ27479.1 Response regulator/sensor histidine kinase [Pseudomonas syringae pv. actinidiae]
MRPKTGFLEVFALPSGFSLIALCLLFLTPVHAAEELAYSTLERAFLQRSPEWIVGLVDSSPAKEPLASAPNYGTELLGIIAQRMKVSLVFKRYPSFAEMDAALCQKTIDVAVDVPISHERSACSTFSEPYFKTPALLVAPESLANGASVESLLKLRAVIVDGDSALDWLKIMHPNTRLLTVDSLPEAMNHVETGKADVLVNDGSDLYPNMGELLNRQLGALPVPDVQTALRFAVPKDDPLRSGLIAKGMSQITEAQYAQLQSRWLNREHASSALFLSEQERQYLAGLPALRVAYDPDWHPVSFINRNGERDGLANDYLKKIVDRLGLKTVEVASGNWKQALFNMASGNADIIMPVTYAESNFGSVLYTRPLVFFSNVIVTSGVRVSRLAELNGKPIVVSDPLYLRDQLHALLPYSDITVADSPEAAMQRVAQGDAMAYVGNLAVINELMRTRFSGALQIVAPVDISGDLSIGVVSEYAPLLPLINRVLRTIPKEEREAINKKWLHVVPQEGVSWVAIKQWLWFSLGAVLTVSLLLIVFYRRLRSEIEQRRIAERAVGDQLQLRESLIETFPYPVLVKDIHKRYFLINHAYESAFSVDKHDLLGKTTLETLHYPGDWSFTIDELATQVMRTRKTFHSEFSMADEQGAVHIWLYWMKPYYRADKTLAGVMVSLVDITQIRQTDQRAKSLEARLNRITSNLLVGVFEASQVAEQLPVFSYLAGPIEELLGISIEDVLDNSALLFDSIHTDDFQQLMEQLKHSATSQTPLRAFFRCRSRGREMHVRIDAVPQVGASGVIVWNGVWVDVTESREKSLKLSQAKEAAEEAARAKSQFLATMSHEIRTPMNGILGLLELLHSKSMTPVQQQIMQMIDDSAKSLMTVLNDVLDLSKIEFNQMQLNFQPSDLRALVSSVMGVMAHQAHVKGLRVRVSISPTLARTINVDDMRLRQVLLNLLSNAIKFTAEGTVSLCVAVTRSAPNTQDILITVSDTGPGMSESQLERIFKPFTQGDASITRRYGGTGLGLVISQHLVRLMGGELRLDSEEGLGAQVSIVLPVEVSSADDQPLVLSGRKVCMDLLNAKDREELSYLLLALGATIVTLEDVDAGLACDLYFFDCVDKALRFPQTLRIEVTASPILSGWRDTEHGHPALSSNPFMWGSLVYMCNELLGGNVLAPMNITQQGGSGRPLILVAEDHPTNQALIKWQLDRLGYDCEIAANGSEALHQFNERAHCMLITDCYMPVMDGYTLARQIRDKIPSYPDFPILAMTASVLVEEQKRCEAAGINACLLKPLSLDTLRDALNKWMRSAKPRSLTVTAQDVDWKTLQTLLDENPEFNGLIGGFIETSEADITYMEGLSIDEQSLIEQLHRLRGGLRMFRLFELATRSEYLEQALAQGEHVLATSDIVGFLQDVRAMLNRLKSLR